MRSFTPVVLAVFFITGCRSTSTDSAPEGIMLFEEAKRVDVAFEDGSVLQHRRNGYQVFTFIKTSSGELAAPLIKMKMPIVGGGSRMDWIDPIWAVGDFQRYMYLPLSSDKFDLLLIVRGIDTSNRDWRFFSVSDVENIQSITFPSLSEMELVETREDQDEVLQLVKLAEQTRYDLRND